MQYSVSDMLQNNQALSLLNKREEEIIYLRKLTDKPTTLEVLSKKYNISSERVRQIESSALSKMKEATLGFCSI